MRWGCRTAARWDAGALGIRVEENECFRADAHPRACVLWVRRGSGGREKFQGAAEHDQGGSVDPSCLEALVGRP